ncbi:MAG TPA: DinB family protein [Gemmatimonadales bacterium]|nr:DinB family protein [Gemmatimonadales bacterium]
MMDERALIQHQLAGSHQAVRYGLSEISDDEARRMPHPVLSPVIWQVGHLAVVNANFIKRAGATSATALPGAYADLFKSGSGGKADYPPLAQVRQAFDDSHEALVRVAAEANLDAADEGPRGLWKNYAGMFEFANAHRWYHIGKIMSLRALLGKPRLFG